LSFEAFNFHSTVVAGVVDEGYENGICQILVATDIAARGIDVNPDFSCYQLRYPFNPRGIRSPHR
jgi:hypothetical protein